MNFGVENIVIRCKTLFNIKYKYSHDVVPESFFFLLRTGVYQKRHLFYLLLSILFLVYLSIIDENIYTPSYPLPIEQRCTSMGIFVRRTLMLHTLISVANNGSLYQLIPLEVYNSSATWSLVDDGSVKYRSVFLFQCQFN